jgi:hypothetical protein
MDDLWLDGGRFAGRSHLASIARGHAALQQRATLGEALDYACRQRWAALLAVESEDLVLCASAGDAMRLVTGALLEPVDVALVAEPTATAIVASVVAVGASYLDLSRLQSGQIDPSALARGIEMHPQAVAIGEAPNLFGTSDRQTLTGVAAGLRAVVLDARGDGGLYGRRVDDGEDVAATILLLRDPDDPASPLLHTVLCRRGTGRALCSLQGIDCLPVRLLQDAIAALDRIAVIGEPGQQRWTSHLEAGYEAVVAQAEHRPGAVVFPRAGSRAVVQCMAGDGVALVEDLARLGVAALAHGPHPMRNLVISDLASARSERSA